MAGLVWRLQDRSGQAIDAAQEEGGPVTVWGIVGTKMDLVAEAESDEDTITKEELEAFAIDVGSTPGAVFLCSSRTGEGVREVAETCCRMFFFPEPPKKKCIVQ